MSLFGCSAIVALDFTFTSDIHKSDYIYVYYLFINDEHKLHFSVSITLEIKFFEITSIYSRSRKENHATFVASRIVIDMRSLGAKIRARAQFRR